MSFRQGDVFWVDLGVPLGSEPGFSRPHVIVQNDVFNQSRIKTLVVCLLTSNLCRANDVGNVLLAPGEGGLPEQSVVNVSQLSTVDKRELREYVGTLSPECVREALRGINLVLEPRDIPS
ncbi:MAG: type II toxin-antitoxin system PemK/MazF family toxin [Rubrobacter sp.]